jgi:hypothetical protein
MDIVDIGNGLSSITFTITENNQSYTDAIVDTHENIAALTKDQIATIQRTRFDNWLAHIQAASQVTEMPEPPAVTYTHVLNDFYTGSDGLMYRLVNSEYVQVADQ